MYQDKSFQTTKGDAGESIYRAIRESEGYSVTHMYKDLPPGAGVRDVDFLCQRTGKDFFGEVKTHDIKTFHGEPVFFLKKQEFTRSTKFAKQQRRDLEFAFVDLVTEKVYIASANRLKQNFNCHLLRFPMDIKQSYGMCWVFHVGQFTEVRPIPDYLIPMLRNAQIPSWN